MSAINIQPTLQSTLSQIDIFAMIIISTSLATNHVFVTRHLNLMRWMEVDKFHNMPWNFIDFSFLFFMFLLFPVTYVVMAAGTSVYVHFPDA